MKNSKNFKISGNDIAGLRMACEDFASRTKQTVIRPSETPAFYFYKNVEMEDEGNAMLRLADIEKMPYPDILNELCANKVRVKFEGASESCAYVQDTQTGQWARLTDILNDLQVLGISGDCTTRWSASLLALASEMAKLKGCSLITRTDENGGDLTVWGIRSKDYTMIPQDQCLDIVTNAFVNEPTDISWVADNIHTAANFAFGDQAVTVNVRGKAKTVTPVLHFVTSDIGDSSFLVRLDWNIDGISMPLRLSKANEVAKKEHKGSWDRKAKDAMTANICKLFNKMATWPTALRYLETIPVEQSTWEKFWVKMVDQSKLKASLGKKQWEQLDRQVRNAVLRNELSNMLELFYFVAEAPSKWTEHLFTADVAEDYSSALAEIPYTKF